jgi:YihY family inner membrane protein
VWRDLERDNISLIAAGLAMYGLLAVFPALAAVISLYGLLFTPDDVIRHMKGFSAILPPGVWDIFNAQLQDVARRQSGTLTLAAVLAAVVALGSARSGMASLMRAANIAYQERESRSLLRRLHVSLAFTLGALVGLILLVALGVAAPLVLHVFSESPWIHGVLAVIRWTLLWIFAVLGCAATYRFAPARALGGRSDALDRRQRTVRFLCRNRRQLHGGVWRPRGRCGAVIVVLPVELLSDTGCRDQRRDRTSDAMRHHRRHRVPARNARRVCGRHGGPDFRGNGRR